MRCKATATRRGVASVLLAATAGLAHAPSARADPIRLRGDALADTRAPAGLVVLQGEDKATPWIDAEGLVWAGAKADATGDVLVLAVHLREPHGIAEARAGRFVVATGAIRPLQMDGASALARAPWGSTIELFGGAPVVPRFADFAYGEVVGGRVGQRFGDTLSFGASYLQRRSHGDVVNDEAGVDVAAIPIRWLDVGGRAAYDLANPGVVDSTASIAARSKATRVELFGSHRSPSRLLPATSLFSVLGDFPSNLVGTTVKWTAAPRLDLLGSAAGQEVGGEYGYNAWIRALLRLDDRGEGSLGLEGRRQDVSSAKWTGVRTTATRPLGRGLRWSTEIELAFPDAPAGRGVVWPWALMALSWRSKSGWEIAGATEGASTPQHEYEIDVLARVSRALELP